jgi:hypothetical protein
MPEDRDVLGATYEAGKPQAPENWRHKLKTRGDMLKYLQSGERYWSSEGGYGSEKRRTPA